MYYTWDQVIKGGANRSASEIVRKNLERKSLGYKTTVFLSHSHQDADVVQSVISFLLTVGVLVYVDWLDPSMPQTTSDETADRIRQKINQCERFVVLLTENSRESKWVPWELGYADGVKTNEDIAIMPVKRSLYTNDNVFDGLEYMRLYRRIQVGEVAGAYVPSIFLPDSNRGMELKFWLYKL